ncbi:hypothetical protein [Fibrella forsythiae]|uniref:Uncharacterized protein n=1 Tax=Fibrella forsythiae TaxID=2817061 RepID=A0ABS3JTK4_9BACT|nr:hypothetical protein [Fibrella forsythiae]MBO0953344.1 hypothetical protein [Fibrella forsythiae]
MVITRVDQTILIQASDSVIMQAIQKLIDYINVLEITAQNQGTEEQAAELARQIDQSWWQANKARFLPLSW